MHETTLASPRAPRTEAPHYLRLRVGADRGPGLAANAARMAKCRRRDETTHALSQRPTMGHCWADPMLKERVQITWRPYLGIVALALGTAGTGNACSSNSMRPRVRSGATINRRRSFEPARCTDRLAGWHIVQDKDGYRQTKS